MLKKNRAVPLLPLWAFAVCSTENFTFLDILEDCNKILKEYVPSVEIIEACFKHSYLCAAPARKVAETWSINMNEHL
jgi:hypothetical protein